MGEGKGVGRGGVTAQIPWACDENIKSKCTKRHRLLSVRELDEVPAAENQHVFTAQPGSGVKNMLEHGELGRTS